MARTMSKIVKYRDYLTERIEPDTLLDRLLANRILCKREVDEVKSRPTICQRNERLLDYITEKGKEEEFIKALRGANQQHLANYLRNDGVRGPEDLGHWPLKETQLKIIDTNCGSFKDVIDIRGGLVDELLAKKVISHRQKQLICSKATDSEMNEAFLDILRRGSIRDYENTIQCLRTNNQDHISEILHDGGAIIPVHVELQEPLAEERLVEVFEDLRRGRSVEEFNRIVETNRLKVISVKKGHSVVFYFYCKTSKLWQELKKSTISGNLKVTIEKLCKRMDSQTKVVIRTVHVHVHVYENIDEYFAKKGNRWSSILPFMTIISIAIASVAIIFGIATIYALNTFPCWTKWLECQEAQNKINALQSVRDRFTLNFEQMQSASSELLKAVQENPNNDEFISLVLKMYETPDEETRQVITEGLRKVDKELTNKAAKRKRIIKKPMENVINLIGKESFEITMDVFQLADDLEDLVRDKHGIFGKTIAERLTVVVNAMHRTVLALLEFAKETEDEQEIYGKTITEKLTSVVNLMHKKILAILEFIKETEDKDGMFGKTLTEKLTPVVNLMHKHALTFLESTKETEDNQEIYGKLVDELIAEVNLMHRTVLSLFQFSKESKEKPEIYGKTLIEGLTAVVNLMHKKVVALLEFAKETGEKQQIHGKTLTEEIRGVVNLMHKRVLALLESTQETEGTQERYWKTLREKLTAVENLRHERMMALQESAKEIEDKRETYGKTLLENLTAGENLLHEKFIALIESTKEIEDKKDIYEKTVTEKLTAVVNSMEGMVLALLEFTEETEGVNNLLRQILETPQEDNDKVCSNTIDIKERKARGYRELRTGMLRLTCLLNETVRLARLVEEELSTQVTLLRQDVKHLTEEVNEFAKQSIPSLLGILLTVTAEKDC